MTPALSTVPSRPTASWWEAVIVLGIPVVVFLTPQLWPLFVGGDVALQPPFTNGRMLRTLTTELALTAALLAWLSRRGWQVRSQVGAPTARDVVRGIGLWVIVFVASQLVRLVMSFAAPEVVAEAQAAPITGNLSLWMLALALLINPLFEETLWLGYAIPTLEQLGSLHSAAAVSILLRVLVHYNQGVHALVNVLPVAVIFTAYFVWTRRLWPVVVAHLVNAVGFSAFADRAP